LFQCDNFLSGIPSFLKEKESGSLLSRIFHVILIHEAADMRISGEEKEVLG